MDTAGKLLHKKNSDQNRTTGAGRENAAPACHAPGRDRQAGKNAGCRSFGGSRTKQEHGGDIYSCPVELDFSVNLNPLGMPEGVKAALEQELETLCTSYPDPRCRRLRAALAERENVPAEQILCTNGASELLYAAAAAEAKLRGQAQGGSTPSGYTLRALLCAPFFSEYEKALSAAGAGLWFYDMPAPTEKQLREGSDSPAEATRNARKSFLLPEAFLTELDGSVDIVYLCNPGNPSGRLVGGELLEKIIQRCHSRHIRLVLDECFLDFSGEEPQRSGKRYLESCPELLVVKAFTKKYALPGLRLGYGLCTDTDFLSCLKEKLPEWNVSAPAQAAGAAALQETQYWERSLRLLKQERPLLQAGLSALGCTVFPSNANFLLFWCARSDLRERLLEQGILIRDCSNFRGLKKGYYRVAVKKREENARLLAAMDRILQSAEQEE